MADKTFIVSDSLQNEVSGILTYDPGTQTATFTAATALAPNTLYSVRITVGVKDIAGNNMASDFNWSFQTGAVLDVDPPTVISVSPGDGETDVALTKTISATFSEPMDASTIVG